MVCWAAVWCIRGYSYDCSFISEGYTLCRFIFRINLKNCVFRIRKENMSLRSNSIGNVIITFKFVTSVFGCTESTNCTYLGYNFPSHFHAKSSIRKSQHNQPHFQFNQEIITILADKAIVNPKRNCAHTRSEPQKKPHTK